MEQLLLAVDIDSIVNLLLSDGDAASSEDIVAVVRAGIVCKGTHLLSLWLLRDNLDEEEKVWTNEPAFRVSQFHQQNQMVSFEVLWNLHVQLKRAILLHFELGDL